MKRSDLIFLDEEMLLLEGLFGKTYTVKEKSDFLAALKTAVKNFKEKNKDKYTFIKSLSQLNSQEKQGLKQIFPADTNGSAKI